ncbi:MAG: hypothetical protein PHT84_03165 [Candidatus Pacebacteria bacterium]|nr:hypothetical protein [Candidatus Paceibacterota bacterium]
MKKPQDIALPFFAYGIFKPGQLAFPRIKDFVYRAEDGYVTGSFKERDGLPLFNPSQGRINVRGTLIHFIEGRERDAYNRIIDIEPDKVYKWDTIKVNDKVNSNVLVGKRPVRGSVSLEESTWDGKEDPLFKYGLKEIESILENNSVFRFGDYNVIFRLQMAYVFLWSIIERYANLRYYFGGKPSEKVKYLADEESFVEGLKTYVKSERVIVSVDQLNYKKLNPGNPKSSIDYYYQVRCNSAHRGKAVFKDFDIIKDSLTELLAIFKYVLDNTLYLAK